MSERRVAIIAGGRTPFVKAGKTFKDMGPLKLACYTVKSLIERHEVDPAAVEALAYGVVVPEPRRPNLAREIVFEAGLPMSIEAQTISSYCITGLRTITVIADAIARDRIEVGVAGDVDSLSHSSPDTFREPTTGLLMGEHTELTRNAWKIPRERQDEIALASHRNAVAARDRLAGELLPLLGEEHDTGPRADTSLEALAALKPVFEENGTLKTEGCEPLAFIRAMEYGAIDPEEGLLMAPAVVVPRLLERASVKLGTIDLIEIHEAFAAQVLASVAAWEHGWRGPRIGSVDFDRVNVLGSSIAIGHPWSATGGRIVTTLANEMARRNARYGLVSICAAGAMAGAFLLERS